MEGLVPKGEERCQLKEVKAKEPAILAGSRKNQAAGMNDDDSFLWLPARRRF
jgi:hypothetical protein